MLKRLACVILAAVVFAGGVLVAALIARGRRGGRAEPPAAGGLEIVYPLDGAVFPPELPAPTARWVDRAGAKAWRIVVELPGGRRLEFRTDAPAWTVPDRAWEQIKQASRDAPARLIVVGLAGDGGGRAVSGGSVVFGTSPDPVGAPIFYREVAPPFGEAVKDPSKIVWRFGPVSSPQRPPVVLGHLPVCANCHSFSLDGKTLGMDVDYGNDKGSYVIADVAPEIVLDAPKIISWSRYRPEDGQRTFGLLSAVSPDGRYVVSTVKDRSVSAPRPDLAFSLDFFPIKGILVVYDRREGSFRALRGADDGRFVQSNPAWSPDGEHIVFARSRVHPLADAAGDDDLILPPATARKFLAGEPFRYDLYRLPFNAGRGGRAEPLQGASHNDSSNYFPKYSPDGKWIVFCRARGYMLLQRDSELWIVPATGGRARRLACNTTRMNSWHTWSPNGRWLAFASKAFSPYTQIFLAHMDEAGRSSPAVVLERFTAPDRAANIPEFVNAGPQSIRRIREEFVGYLHYGDRVREAAP